LTLGKDNVSKSEVYVAGTIDRKLSLWFSQQLKMRGLAQDKEKGSE
jgi:hypothetical protein